MQNDLNRREFLKLSGMGFGSLAIDPMHRLLPPEDRVPPVGIGRVTVSSIEEREAARALTRPADDTG